MRDLLRSHDFKTLFIQLGWDNFDATQNIEGYQFKAIASKGGLPVFVCKIPNLNGLARKTALDLDNQLAKFAAEHIIVWHDEHAQLWQFSKREIGKANKFNRFGPYPNSHSFENLISRLKGLGISLDEEIKAGERGGFGVIEIAARINRNFDVDNVSKKFYDGFKKQRDALLTFLEGLEGRVKDEYASLMLTRLMFLYFMQAKEFLLGDTAYLRNHFENPDARLRDGDDFYHGFLCPLFFEVLSKKRDERFARKGDDDKRGFAVFGDLIYLNGGLFARRDFESGKIGVDDAFFESLFEFFDKWNWVLDDRPTRDGNEINPDVLGYVFEKFINQKQMGAYYTKEDITGYIARNSILPFLFEKAAPDAQRALDLVRNNPARYVYPAVKHGCHLDLPAYIDAGIGDVAARGRWNETATGDLGLPTEIWREVVARRQRYFAITRRDTDLSCLKPDASDIVLASPDNVGGDTIRHDKSVSLRDETVQFDSVADLITHNLDLELWMTDVIANLETQDEVWNLWQALEDVTVLDPTVGSGAFLFAAMNILEPLYRELLARMDEVVEDFDARSSKHPHLLAGRVEEFREKVREMDAEVNRGYQTFKKMMVSNLYGVDIMGEAVEICKLRLFLKLASQATPQVGKPNLGIQPLPDIDFNIRAGNTLVGFATLKEAEKAAIEQLALGINWPDVADEARTYGAELEKFRELQRREQQITLGAKRELERKHDHLIASFDLFLGGTYGQMVKSDPKGYEQWRQTHQPFHWCAEFYNVMQSGGFDVIIGNPPYVEYSKVRGDYKVRDYQTVSCGNLYAFVMERSLKILNPMGKIGLIVPLASFGTARMNPLQALFSQRCSDVWVSNYEATTNPTQLFVGVKVQLSIVLSAGSVDKKTLGEMWTTNYLRSFAEERESLFANIQYHPALFLGGKIARAYCELDKKVLAKIFSSSTHLQDYFVGTKRSEIYFRNMGNFFFKLAFDREPVYLKNGEQQSSSTVSVLEVPDEEAGLELTGLINSTLFYYYWVVFSDCYHLTSREIQNFPFDRRKLNADQRQELENLSRKLQLSLKATSTLQTENKKDGTIKVYERYFPQKSKPIIDEIDRVLAGHYGLSDEELDFIINYDIKYRMGRESGDD